MYLQYLRYIHIFGYIKKIMNLTSRKPVTILNSKNMCPEMTSLIDFNSKLE